MSKQPVDVIQDLLTLDVISLGPNWIRNARILADAVDAIERLTPPKLTRAEAVAVLREHKFRGTDRWSESSPELSEWGVWELFAAAEKLIRDGGPKGGAE